MFLAGRVVGVDCGDEVAVWLTSLLGRTCRLVRQSPQQKRSSKRRQNRTPNEQELPSPPLSLANKAQYLLLAQGSMEQLLQEVRRKQPHWTTMDSSRLASRFRANFVVSGDEMEPYSEENWKEIRVGSHLFQVSSQQSCCHCVTLNILGCG